MGPSSRVATVVYALTVFTVGYVAAATIHDFWVSRTDEVQARYEIMSYDRIVPAAGVTQ